jgi:hypothetical protein
MNRLLASMGLVAALSATALAQGVDSGLSGPGVSMSNTTNLGTAPAAGVEGDGYKIGEGTSLYPVFGVSTGAISNVFYEDTDTHAAGVLRLVGQIGAGSLSSSRLSANTPSGVDGSETNLGSFQYRASLRLAYDFMLSGNDAVTSQGGLGVGATLRGIANPNGPFSFGFDENFTRLIRAANFETDADTNRDLNNLALNLIYHAAGRSLAGYLYYRNTIDVFENDDINFADRMQHRFGLHPLWRVLPQSVVYADVSLGVFTGLGSASTKVTSYPLIAQAGFATLLSPLLTVNLHAGYTNGFYSEGPSYSAFTGGAQLGYRYSELGRIALTYDLLYEDSVNANYYRDHVVRLSLQQQFVPFLFTLQPELHFRKYDGITDVMGPPTRNDVIFATAASLRYNFRNNLSASLDYLFSLVSSDYRYMAGDVIDDPSYARHQILLGVLWAL